MVVDVAVVDELVVVDQGDVAVGELVEDLADRADRAADLDQLPLQQEEPLERVGGGLADDLVLDLVDRVTEAVGEREVAIHDVVGEGPQEVVGPWRRTGSRPPRRWLESRGSQLAWWTVSRKPRPRTMSSSEVETSSS